MRRIFTFKLLFLLSVLLVNAQGGHCDWVQDGGIFNVDPNRNAYAPDIAVDNNTPYVVWSEEDGAGKKQIYVKKYNGISWDHASGSVESLNVDPNESANYPSIAAYSNTPYVVWAEDEGNTRVVYVKYLNGTTWTQMGGRLNVDPNKFADFPAIALDASTPYITWREDNAIAYQIYCKHWNGSDWEQDGGSLNLDGNISGLYPNIIIPNSTPHITWEENFIVYVKRLNGITWEQIGGGLNINLANPAGIPYISADISNPYVAWTEIELGVEKIYVKHFQTTNWIQDGNALNINPSKSAYATDIEFDGSVQYVLFYEKTFVVGQILDIRHLYVKHFNGSNWIQDGASLNIDENYNTRLFNSGIDFVNSTPYVVWSEESATNNKIYCKYYIPPTPTQTPTITVTSTISQTATISPTPTVTPTYSPTGTITATATITPTITRTATITPTATISPTETSTPTGTPTSSLDDVDLEGRTVLAYPNPAQNRVNFLMHLAAPAKVEIAIYSISGDLVAELEENLMAGRGQVLEWDCSGVGAGVYIARILVNGKQVEVSKVAVIK